MKVGLRSSRGRPIAIAGAIGVGLVVALAGGSMLMQSMPSPSASLAAKSAAPGTPTPPPGPTIDYPNPGSSVPPGKTPVVWMVGLEGGAQGSELAVETQLAEKYNATNPDNVFLEIELIPNWGATGGLQSAMEAGEGPDLLGPVGIQGRVGLSSDLLDITGEIARIKTDLGAFPPAQLAAFRDPAGRYQSLPYIEYPAFIFYNKDLFKAAGLPDLPIRVGEKYMGQDWTWDELATIAKQLTVDTSGKRSTDAGFNPAKIKTYGFDTQWIDDLRRFATPFGAGSYVAADGKTAQIPPAWEQAWKWYCDAMWKSHFAPTNAERMTAAMGNGTTAATGRVAMELSWAWAVSSFGVTDQSGAPTPTASPPFAHWGMGVLPSNVGVTTDPLDADSFVINKRSKVPDAAYKAMLAIMAEPNLIAAYGAMPAAPSLQAAYFQTAQAAVNDHFPGNPVTWSVLTQMANYAASPTHQDAMPNYVKATVDDQALYTRLQSDGKLDLDVEIGKLKTTLQADFAAG